MEHIKLRTASGILSIEQSPGNDLTQIIKHSNQTIAALSNAKSINGSELAFKSALDVVDEGTKRLLAYRYLKKDLSLLNGAEKALIPIIKKHRKKLIGSFIEETNVAPIVFIFTLYKIIKKDELDGYIELSHSSPEILTYLLNYKNQHYSTEASELLGPLNVRLENTERTAEEWKHVLKFTYTDGGTIITGIKDVASCGRIPSKIGKKEVIGLNLHIWDTLGEYQPPIDMAIFDRARLAFEQELEIVKTASPNDLVSWGVFPAGSGAVIKPIQWRVVKKAEGKVQLVSQQWIDIRSFDDEMRTNVWGKSSLRKWLNGLFFSVAFSDNEKMRILPENEEYVRLLSTEEAMRIQDDLPLFESMTSYYAPNQAAWDTHRWWLESAGKRNKFDDEKTMRVATVESDGHINTGGTDVTSLQTYGGVRPTIWVDITK